MTTTMRDRRGPSCVICGSPTGLPWNPAKYDGVPPVCSLCEEPVRKPTVHLYGRPDGQELARWTSDDIDPRLASEQGRRNH